jgi:hypothetical protein
MDESENDKEISHEFENKEENEVNFDICTLEDHDCGFKTMDGLCLQKYRCAYQLSEKWISIHDPNDKPTVEALLELIKKHGKLTTKGEILAIIPEDERAYYPCLDEKKKEGRSFLVIDYKGNIINVRTWQVIRHNLKL